MRRSYLLAAILCLTLLLAGCTGGTPGSEGDATTATVATTAAVVDDTNGSAVDATATTAVRDEPTTEVAPTPEPTATPGPTATTGSGGSDTTKSTSLETTRTKTSEPTTGTATSIADATPGEAISTSSVALHEGEYYRLDTTVSDALVEFEVLSVEGKEATVEVTATPPDGTPSTTTIRGDTASVMEQIVDSQPGFGFFLLARAPTAVVEGRNLAVGDEFTVDSADVTAGGQTPEPGTFSVAVTGTDSVSGIECTTVDIDLDGQNRQTACVNPDLLFAPRTTLYDDEGDSTGTIFIEEYRAG